MNTDSVKDYQYEKTTADPFVRAEVDVSRGDVVTTARNSPSQTALCQSSSPTALTDILPSVSLRYRKSSSDPSPKTCIDSLSYDSLA